MKRALILAEGQTEERFVKDVLREHFWTMDLDIAPTVLVTKRVKDGPDFKGGVTSFRSFERDMKRLLGTGGGALVTTMLDYNGLPSDFPGMVARPAGDLVSRVTFVEKALHAHFGERHDFVPYLSLHEFQALVFASPDELPRTLVEPAKQPRFTAIRSAFKTPEEIDQENRPSRRVGQLFPAYRKTLHGPIVAGRIGLEKMRQECPHFNQWLERLEAYARN